MRNQYLEIPEHLRPAYLEVTEELRLASEELNEANKRYRDAVIARIALTDTINKSIANGDLYRQAG